ncbi:Hypothetical_protein [Hexamita inflata]|uniref:Hypothetical_protein n=1 Tax=Hexamita inflata TaxID=28002 RepID=A0ABP1GI00_9EUKA
MMYQGRCYFAYKGVGQLTQGVPHTKLPYEQIGYSLTSKVMQYDKRLSITNYKLRYFLFLQQNDSLNCNLIINTKAPFNYSIFISQIMTIHKSKLTSNQSLNYSSSSRIVTLNNLRRQPKLVRHLNQHC